MLMLIQTSKTEMDPAQHYLLNRRTHHSNLVHMSKWFWRASKAAKTTYCCALAKEQIFTDQNKLAIVYPNDLTKNTNTPTEISVHCLFMAKLAKDQILYSEIKQKNLYPNDLTKNTNTPAEIVAKCLLMAKRTNSKKTPQKTNKTTKKTNSRNSC